MEFRRYRQVLTVAYVGVMAAGAILLTASVVKQLLFRRPAVDAPSSLIEEAAPDPAALLACHAEVHALLGDLGETTCALLEHPTRDERVEVGNHWKDFSRSWNDRWDLVNKRCGFEELAGTSLGDGYDRMAQVHSDLPRMRLKYQSLLVRFDDEQAAELARMRRALDQSEAALRSEANRHD